MTARNAHETAPASTTRREFLAGSLAALGACALAPRLALGAEGAPALASKMRLGLATYQWGMDWDIPTLIANCAKAGVLGVELRTQSKYKHGIELESSPERRAEAKKRFADSPVAVVAVACSARMDWPDAAKLKADIQSAKDYLKLSAEIGSKSLRVFPNQFNPGVEHEKTIAQIAKALNELGPVAEGLGQRVDIEAHGPAGELTTIHAIMEQVTHKAVGVRLNCDARDNAGAGLAANFALVKDRLARTVHLHNLTDPKFPYALQIELLAKAGWEGWALMEDTDKVPDRVQAMIEQRKLWEGMLAKAAKA